MPCGNLSNVSVSVSRLILRHKASFTSELKPHVECVLAKIEADHRRWRKSRSCLGFMLQLLLKGCLCRLPGLAEQPVHPISGPS